MPTRLRQPTRARTNGFKPSTRSRNLKIVVATFVGLVLFDAIVGGSMGALLRVEGWFYPDQRINDVYQLAYGLFVAVTLAWLYYATRSLKLIAAVWVLFLGYVEDTFFYVLMPIVNPVIRFLAAGEGFGPPDGGLFPQEISGWAGWCGRVFFDSKIMIRMNVILGLNLLAISLALLLLLSGGKGQKRRNLHDHPISNARQRDRLTSE